MLTKEEIYHHLQGFETVPLSVVSVVKLMDRIDTKFVTSIDRLFEFVLQLKNDFFVQEIEGDLIAEYNTVYYDTDDVDYFKIHQSGKSGRQKIRVRNYLDTHSAFVEVKNKNNKGRTKKKRVACQPLSDCNLHDFSDFLEKYSMFPIDNLTPHLQNRFFRVTLLNKAHTERLTLDFNLAFDNWRTHQQGELSLLGIIELKQQGNIDSKAKEIMHHLRIRPKGFSKYCIGCALTNPALRVNNFKKKLRYIHKIAKIR